MKLRVISSHWTVFYKFILPGVYILGFFFNADPVSLSEKLVFGSLGLAFFLLNLNIKWVAIDELNGRLYVSNYRREISIPLSHIARVEESLLSEPRRIKIYLKQPSEFGSKIVFYGTYRFGGIFAGSHPIVKELLKLSTHKRSLSI